MVALVAESVFAVESAFFIASNLRARHIRRNPIFHAGCDFLGIAITHISHHGQRSRIKRCFGLKRPRGALVAVVAGVVNIKRNNQLVSRVHDGLHVVANDIRCPGFHGTGICVSQRKLGFTAFL